MQTSPNIWRVLADTAARRPGSVAVVDAAGSGACSYAALLASVERRALHLRALGVAAGDRVAVFEHNRRTFLELYFAVAGLGAILVPLNIRLHPLEIGNVLRDAGARLLLVGEGLAPPTVDVPVREIPALGRDGRFDPAPADHDMIAQLYYTSGTTGEPKGVALTHGNVCHHASAAIEELALVPSDTWAHMAPMFHLADAWSVFAITQVGGRHVMLPEFEPEEALRCLASKGITLTNLVPTMLQRMLAERLAEELTYPALRLMLSGGAPIAPATVRRVLAVFGCDYAQTYGMTETSPYLTISLLHDHLRELPFEEQLEFKCKTGRPFLGVDLRVVNEAGQPVTTDGRAVGEIQVRGATVTPGYWNRPDATEAAFVDGWLMTGDLATVDAEGYVNIVDRKKDVILTGGETVYSVEVENALYHHPAVVQAAVFGRPDEEWGEIVCAAVVLAPEAPPDIGEAELQAHCRTTLAGFEVPRRIDIVADLPRTGSGKIAKRLLRDA